MAYFSNSSEGSRFDDQCGTCVLGEKPCPVAFVQGMYNYDAMGNEVATSILDNLVRDTGECVMLIVGKKHLLREVK